MIIFFSVFFSYKLLDPANLQNNRILGNHFFNSFSSIKSEYKHRNQHFSPPLSRITSPPLSPGSENDYNLSGVSGHKHRRSVSPRPGSLIESYEGSRSPSNSEITAVSIEGEACRPQSNSPTERTTPSPSPSPSNSSNKKAAGTSGPNPFAEGLKPKCNWPELERVECRLETKDLWDKFNELGTEMIITKTGR